MVSEILPETAVNDTNKVFCLNLEPFTLVQHPPHVQFLATHRRLFCICLYCLAFPQCDLSSTVEQIRRSHSYAIHVALFSHAGS